MAESGVALGKGAWDCDNNCLIPPEKEVRRPAAPGCRPCGVEPQPRDPGHCPRTQQRPPAKPQSAKPLHAEQSKTSLGP